MGHIVNGRFQSDKYPTCPPGKVPLSTKDKDAQDLLWEYAQRRRAIDDEFAHDLEVALRDDGYQPDQTLMRDGTLRWFKAMYIHMTVPLLSYINDDDVCIVMLRAFLRGTITYNKAGEAEVSELCAALVALAGAIVGKHRLGYNAAQIPKLFREGERIGHAIK